MGKKKKAITMVLPKEEIQKMRTKLKDPHTFYQNVSRGTGIVKSKKVYDRSREKKAIRNYYKGDD